MRIAIACTTARGGVQPYVAARGLAAAGHEVRALAPEDLAPMFSSAGIPATALAGVSRRRCADRAAWRAAPAATRMAAELMPSSSASAWTATALEAARAST